MQHDVTSNPTPTPSDPEFDLKVVRGALDAEYDVLAASACERVRAELSEVTREVAFLEECLAQGQERDLAPSISAVSDRFEALKGMHTTSSMVTQMMDAGVTAEAIADAMGNRVSPRTIFRWKAGTSTPQNKHALRELQLAFETWQEAQPTT